MIGLNWIFLMIGIIYFDFDHKSPLRNEGGQLNGGTTWYRKTFTLNEADKNKDVRINFDGVLHGFKGSM